MMAKYLHDRGCRKNERGVFFLPTSDMVLSPKESGEAPVHSFWVAAPWKETHRRDFKSSGESGLENEKKKKPRWSPSVQHTLNKYVSGTMLEVKEDKQGLYFQNSWRFSSPTSQNRTLILSAIITQKDSLKQLGLHFPEASYPLRLCGPYKQHTNK
jgi:hypothetical protein